MRTSFSAGVVPGSGPCWASSASRFCNLLAAGVRILSYNRFHSEVWTCMHGVAYAELGDTYLLMNSPSWIFSGSWWSFKFIDVTLLIPEIKNVQNCQYNQQAGAPPRTSEDLWEKAWWRQLSIFPACHLATGSPPSTIPLCLLIQPMTRRHRWMVAGNET